MKAIAGPEEGKTVFEQMCVSCHTIGQGKRVGPDLKGVTTRRETTWLTQWLMAPDKVLAANDPTATELLNEFNGIPMPNQNLTEAQVASLIAYLGSQDGATTTPTETVTETAPVPETTPQDEASTHETLNNDVLSRTEPPMQNKALVALGQDLFQGKIRLANQGPSCNSCHHVKNDAIIGGGVLAKELTTVFTRMGGDGVRAILGSPPFPVMQVAYKDKSLTKEEISALIAFLEQADKDHSFQQPRDYGFGLFFSGMMGTGVLLGIYSLFGRNRKSSVNQAIYDRQVKSSDDRKW